MGLTSAQLAALAHVRASGGPRSDPPDAVVTINFHPDRVDAGGRTVIEGLLEWCPGSRLFPDGIDDEFRGPEMRPLAVSLCARWKRPYVDAELIGRAARDARADPEMVQLLKYLWHALAVHGR